MAKYYNKSQQRHIYWKKNESIDISNISPRLNGYQLADTLKKYHPVQTVYHVVAFSLLIYPSIGVWKNYRGIWFLLQTNQIKPKFMTDRTKMPEQAKQACMPHFQAVADCISWKKGQACSMTRRFLASSNGNVQAGCWSICASPSSLLLMHARTCMHMLHHRFILYPCFNVRNCWFFL